MGHFHLSHGYVIFLLFFTIEYIPMSVMNASFMIYAYDILANCLPTNDMMLKTTYVLSSLELLSTLNFQLTFQDSFRSSLRQNMQ